MKNTLHRLLADHQSALDELEQRVRLMTADELDSVVAARAAIDLHDGLKRVEAALRGIVSALEAAST